MATNKMHIAIISNGPSAKLFTKREDFDLVIAVNKAAQKYRCDWWVFYDAKTLFEIDPIGNPCLAVSHHVPDKFGLFGGNIAEKYMRAPETFFFDTEITIPNWPKDADKWCCYSGLAALGVAYHLGAKQISVFGVDMNGDRDCLGDLGGTRTQQRWDRERRMWDMLVSCIEAEGILVRRIQ